MKKYEKYKDSEIKWLGKIPEHWEIRRIKDLGEYKSGNFIDVSEIDYSSKYAVMGGNGLRGYTDKFNRNGSYILIGRQGALCGNINYATGKFWATEHAVVVHHKKNINIKWLGELLRVMNLNQYSFTTAQPGLSVEKIKALKLPLVPFEEQVIIANYLDTKTQLIDKKIELLNKKIQKYRELRKTIVNKAVCQGLDSNVKFKESGIEWIGKIPEHWDVYRLKDIGFLYSGLSGKSGNDFYQENHLNNKYFIPYTNILNNISINTEHMGIVVVEEKEKQNKVKMNDIFFLMSSEDYEGLGKSSILKTNLKNTYLNSFCKGFRIKNKNIIPDFINYQLSADSFRQLLKIEGKGFTRMNLKTEKVSEFKVFIPQSIEEQQEIILYINLKLEKIDNIIKVIQQQIAKLQELRKTLINDVVTGKIKVTE